jgi:N-methylhydantoinase B
VQEGLVLPPVRLARVRPDGTADVVDDVLAIVLANVRTPGERLGDLRAQLAACAAGRAAWQALWRREGGARVGLACDALLDYAERRTRARLGAFEGAAGAAEDALEGDGVSDVPVRVRAAVRVAAGRLCVDLAGTAPRVAGNVNCPRAVARAAAVFALRTLLDDDVPTNDGVARALDLVVPDGCAADARDGAAVAAGNVEMSQRLADVMLAALAAAGLDVPAQGQGTMNNVTFGAPAAPGGAAGWTFYETLGGGQGASSRGAGPSGVHVGMSNTRVTPVEALELAYPLRVERYALRDGSGGAGRHAGGDGRRAQLPRAGAVHGHAANRTPPDRAARCRGRRRRRARPEPARRRPAPRQGARAARRGRPPDARDAGRRRVGPARARGRRPRRRGVGTGAAAPPRGAPTRPTPP